MKKISIIFLCLFAIAATQGQQIKISYAAKNNATIDSIEVINKNLKIRKLLKGNDILILGDDERNLKNNFQILPNPVENDAEIIIFAKTSGTMQIFLYNTEGKEVATYSNNLDEGGHKLILKDLPAGSYYISAIGNGYSYNGKIISRSQTQNRPSFAYSSTISIRPNIELKQQFNGVSMPYSTGDKFTYKAYSNGRYKSYNDEPTYSKTITFDFKNTKAPYSCNGVLTINHTHGLAPENVTIDYQTVESDPTLTGTGAKCWIAQNLGAYHPAGVTNATGWEEAGWYFQFNRPQAFKNDGNNGDATTTWSMAQQTINENSNWIFARDPCYNMLGKDWRIPTRTEWYNVYHNTGWGNSDDAFYGSVGNYGPLNLHNAGYLENTHGYLTNRGHEGYYWSSMQDDNPILGWSLYMNHNSINTAVDNKAYAMPIRCIRNNFDCDANFDVSHLQGDGISADNATITYKAINSDVFGPDRCVLLQNLGASSIPTSYHDGNPATEGWYWQFNRKQGYTHQGGYLPANVIPFGGISWQVPIAENSIWTLKNDPCQILDVWSSPGWRLPTKSEWEDAIINNNWFNHLDVWNTGIALHGAGYITIDTVKFATTGKAGFYWSRNQSDNQHGYYFEFSDHIANMFFDNGNLNQNGDARKTTGNSVRCIRNKD